MNIKLMAISIFNIGKANAALNAAAAALVPAMEAAGIKTISVDGKAVAYADAPLAAQISALIAAQPPVSNATQISDVLVSNEQIAGELDKTKTELAVAQTSVATLTRENGQLKQDLATSQTSVQTLTVENGDLKNRLTAATNQFSANAKELASRDTDLSRLCIAAGCLELTDVSGKALAKDATEEQKMEAAGRISHSDKLKAYRGAVNAAIAKTGASPLEIPTLPPGERGQKAQELKGRDRMKAGMKIEGYPSTQTNRN